MFHPLVLSHYSPVRRRLLSPFNAAVPGQWSKSHCILETATSVCEHLSLYVQVLRYLSVINAPWGQVAMFVSLADSNIAITYLKTVMNDICRGTAVYRGVQKVLKKACGGVLPGCQHLEFIGADTYFKFVLFCYVSRSTECDASSGSWRCATMPCRSRTARSARMRKFYSLGR